MERLVLLPRNRQRRSTPHHLRAPNPVPPFPGPHPHRSCSCVAAGSSGATRRAAATQIGDLQKLHPHELQTLLSRVRNIHHHHHFYDQAADQLYDIPSDQMKVADLPNPPDGHDITSVDVIIQIAPKA